MTRWNILSLTIILACAACALPIRSAPPQRFMVDMPAYLSQYDVVYQCPAVAPDEGLPLGNGDLCAAVWNTDALNLTINKSDVWTTAGKAPTTAEEYREGYTTHREELLTLQKQPNITRYQFPQPKSAARPPHKTQLDFRLTTQYTLGEIALRLGKHPQRDNFLERLSLSTGMVTCQSGEMKSEVYVDEGRGLIVIHVTGAPADGPREVELWHWDVQQFGAEGGTIWLQHRAADDEAYALAIGAQGVTAEGKVTEDGHRAVLKLGPGSDFYLYIAAVSIFDDKQMLPAARKLLDDAQTVDAVTRAVKRQAYWRRFWERSYVDFSDPYVANLWYLFVYQMGCASRGKYPPRFEAGYWGARGFYHWPNGYWQYNEMMLYYMLDAANHPELMEPYTNLIANVLPSAKLQTQAFFGLPGAQYSHCMTVTGQPFDGPGDMMKYVLSTSGLYATYMWQHYQYTGDLDFLKAQAYPVMREVLTFLHSYLEHQLDAQGNYIIYPSHPVEDADTFVGNPQVDIAILHNLTSAVIIAEKKLQLTNGLTTLAKEMQGHIPPYPEADGTFRAWQDYGKTARFQVKPDAPADAWDALPAWCEFPGGWQGVAGQGRTRNTMGMGLANVFPVPEISLHSDSALLEKARASFQFMDGDWRGFSPALIIAARLGLQDKVLPGLAQFSIRSQCGPQGWMTYMGSRKALDGRMKNGEDFDRLDQPRYQPYFEPLGGMTAATTTMLLDSLGGVIHVFPAYPRKGDARFCLRATNGLLVTGDMRNGEIAYVAISDAALQPMRVTNMDVSHDGVQPAGNAVPLPAGNAYETTVCAIANPWPGKVAQIVDATTGKIIVKPTTDAILRFIRPGIASLYLERPEFPAKEYPLLIVSGKPQQGPRVNGSVMLGMPKEGWPRYSGPTPGQIREQKLRAWQESLRPANLPNLAAAATGAVPWVLNPQNHPNRHNPAYLNDGLYGNDHSTISGGDAAMLGEFGIDLNRVETIGSVVWSRERNLKPGTPSSSDRTPKDYRIEVSLDKQQWTTVCTVTGNTTANGRREEFPPVKARYVRMLVTATSLPAPCLDELEVLPPDPDVRFKSLETLRAIPRGQAPDLTNPGGPSWATALRLDEFLQYAKRKLAPVQTQAWLLHDGQYLYVAVHCTEPLMTKLQSAVLPHDSENLFNGDDIELFLLPDPAGKEYYQIGINPDGSYIDARCLREPTTGNPLSFRMELAWNPQLQVNARKKADGWELTVRLPLKEAGLIPGKSFALQIGRNRKAADELSTWMFTDIGFHNPPTFGKMILE